MNFRKLFVAAVLAVLSLGSSAADVTIGVIYSSTGPGASIGITQQRTIPILPATLGGQKVTYIGLDDGSDTTTAVKNVRKLASENSIDVLIGPSLTTSSLAVLDVIAETRTPMISMASGAAIVEPIDAKRFWAFKTPQSDAMMASIIVEHMASSGAKRIGFLGLADGYGDGWLREFTRLAAAQKLNIVATERYARTDTSVMGPVLKLLGANVDTVFIASFGSPAVLPQASLVERGFKGRIYQTHGVANNDFLRLGGANLEGTFVPAGPVLVVEQLPADHPSKKSGLEFVTRYEAIPGAGARSTFAAYLWDAVQILDKAIPQAIKLAAPGTPQFRAALRDAIENTKGVHGPNGVYNMSTTDHIGLDNRSRVMTQIRNGKWKYMP